MSPDKVKKTSKADFDKISKLLDQMEANLEKLKKFHKKNLER